MVVLPRCPSKSNIHETRCVNHCAVFTIIVTILWLLYKYYLFLYDENNNLICFY